MKRSVVALIMAGVVVALAWIPGSAVSGPRNADKVDGFDAVAARASLGRRSEVLVATNSKGYLPRDIVREVAMADDADKVDGYGAAAFVQKCTEGALRGWASVPATLGSEYAEVPGDGTLYGGPVNVEGGACHDWPTTARQVSTGVYRVDVALAGLGDCDRLTDDMLSAVVTVVNRSDTPLLADYRPLCEDPAGGRVVAEVRVFDLNGTPTDSAFTIAVLRAQGDPIP